MTTKYSTPVYEQMRKNIEIMNNSSGFDIIIVCCSTEQQADYWQKRLENGKGSILQKSTIVLGVHEDWPGGAGNVRTIYFPTYLIYLYKIVKKIN